MMNRRRFLAATATGIALAQRVAPAGRRVLPLNRNWQYRGKDAGAFVPVTLPHTNVMLPWHSFDEKSYLFTSHYRRTLRVPAAWKGQRIFVDFAGAMTASKVSLNGKLLGEHLGGYTPFSFELTSGLQYNGKDLLEVEVDSTERKDIPPFGNKVDYLTFGGLYREAQLRVVPTTFIENVFAQPANVMDSNRRVIVRTQINGPSEGMTLTATLRDGARVLKTATAAVGAELILTDLPEVALWNLKTPKLYSVDVQLNSDLYTTRIGFRDAQFTDKGFYLNGEHIKLRGLNRHQTYPYVGGAMPATVQRRDALILRNELKCNIVRTSHYPQSTHFLDACDECGLLVLEEIPGWQFIGDKPWQDLAVKNVEAMVRRDWNHPGIVLWGVRINESADNHDFYSRTSALARELDPSRQTGGIRNRYDSELLEDVFTMNDFGFPLRPPNHPRYLNTEFNGHMFSTKHIDNVERVAEHVIRHARVHDQLASSDGYAGGIAWCAFDYASHDYFGSGDRICYHGVSDIFRLPKPAAGFYKSQCDPVDEVVLEPGFDWSWGDRPSGNGPGLVPICSNCDMLKLYIGDRPHSELTPDRKQFPNLKYAPFTADLRNARFDRWGDLKIEGYIAGKLAITKTLSGKGVDAALQIHADGNELKADGSDATRVVIRVVDDFGNPRQFSTASVVLSLEGPGEIVGENPFSVVGGVGAVWIKTKETPGTIRLTAKVQYLPSQRLEITTKQVPPEAA
jgi:beta-galactosidase